LVAIDQAEPVPDNVNDFSGLALMGGPMSVNDDLPWIEPVLRLIRAAVADHVPVVGHCLGGQLLSKALGGVISRNPVKEIGWGQVSVEPGPVSSQWLGDIEVFDSFHWHGETFTDPPGAVRLLSNRWCRNQGFVLGLHIGMQCHVEMTEDLVRTWVSGGMGEIAESLSSPAVQSPEDIERDLSVRVATLRGVADRIYDRWALGLKT
jgi:GMP synthase-like glutamine amidotransferase